MRSNLISVLLKHKGYVKLFMFLFFLVFLFLPSAVSAQVWHWPLSEEPVPLKDREQHLLLRPGITYNPVYGNTFSNYGYFITGRENMPVYAPETGTITVETSCVIYPDNIYIQGINPSASPEQLTALKRRNPLLTPENTTRGICITLQNGKKVYIYGLKTVLKHKGERVKKGEQLGTLGFIKTFSYQPCLSIVLSTKEGKADNSIGLCLLDEDSTPLFDTMMQKRQSIYQPNRILTKEEQKQAWHIFTVSLQNNHPVFSDKKHAIRINHAWEILYGELSTQKDMRIHTLAEYMNRALAALHCCHTVLFPADREYRYPLCPLQLTVHNGRCFTVWDRRGKQEIPIGTEITSINDIPVADLVHRITQTISTDSLNYAVAQEIVEQHFTAELQRFLPVDSEYTFAIKSEILLSAENRAGEINVRLPVLTKEQASSSACYPVWFGRIADSPFEILDEMTARIGIKKMNRIADEEQLCSWFKTIAEKNIQNVIIDLRGNDGGGENAVGLFLSFLLPEPFSFAAYSELRTDEPPDRRISEPTQPVHNTLAVYKRDDTKRFFPAKQYRFTGKIYVLVDALTVSAGVNTARLLKNAGATVIGTETRGGYYSCNAIQYIHTRIPAADLILRIPIYRQVFTDTLSPSIPIDRGLIPDYVVPLTIDDKLYGSDSQFDFCMRIIER